MLRFQFKIYVNRYKTHITYTITKTPKGWHLKHIAHSGETSPDGSPLLVENFNQDNISYPSGIGGFFEHVWNGLEQQEISERLAAERIQQLADWVSSCEQSQPRWVGWNH